MTYTPELCLCLPNILSDRSTYPTAFPDAQILAGFPVAGREGAEDVGSASSDELYLIRWGILRECLAAMVQCRERDKWDARSVYTRARTIEKLCAWEPPGRVGGERAAMYVGMCGGIVDMVGEARDVMVLMYDKRRPQIAALWMPDEGKDHFEIVNQVRGPMPRHLVKMQQASSVTHP